jgi:hypothetical protein
LAANCLLVSGVGGHGVSRDSAVMGRFRFGAFAESAELGQSDESEGEITILLAC